MMFKLPAAFFTGVRVKFISNTKSRTAVRFRWVNQNPFKSMFWAVQGMAAELATGVLMMQKIDDSGKNISMLVTSMNASFIKKAKGKIVFECSQGVIINETIEKAISTNEGQQILLTSIGKDEEGNVVSSFDFEWSVKVK